MRASSARLASLACCLSLMTVLLSGCWDRIETNDLAFVLTSSVDLEPDGRVRVSYLLPLPGQMGGASGGGGGTGGGRSYYIDSEVGDTFREATTKLQRRMARKLFLSHRRSIMIGEEFAKNGITSLFDAVPRLPESRMTTFLVVTKGKGYELLNTEPKFERFPAEAIRELAKSPQTMPITTKDVGVALSFQSDPVIVYMNEKETQSDKKTSKEIELFGYAQFKDDRMVGVYRNEAAQGLMWLRNRVKPHLVNFPAEDGQIVSIQVTQGNSRITPIVKDDQVTFRVLLDVFGKVREDRSQQDLNEARILHKYERNFGEHIKKMVEATIKQMKEKGTDSAQLGLTVWRKYPDQWKNKLKGNWPELFRKAEFQIEVDASITETGLINQNVTKDGIQQ